LHPPPAPFGERLFLLHLYGLSTCSRALPRRPVISFPRIASLALFDLYVVFTVTKIAWHDHRLLPSISSFSQSLLSLPPPSPLLPSLRFFRGVFSSRNPHNHRPSGPRPFLGQKPRPFLLYSSFTSSLLLPPQKVGVFFLYAPFLHLNPFTVPRRAASFYVRPGLVYR